MSIVGKPRDERGAVAPFVAVLIVLLVGLASFAVDLGYQRVAARDMQAVADIVAMDMARQLDGRATSALLSDDSWETSLEVSLERNADASVGDPLEPAIDCEIEGPVLTGAQICATPGIYNSNADPQDRFKSSGASPATHVRVITRTKVDYFFPLYADGGWVTKTAYAQADESACFSVGSYAARLKSGESALLNGLLGDAVDLQVLGSSGVADASVGLGPLGAELGAGTTQELLDTKVSIADFKAAMVSALKMTGKTADAEALEALNIAAGTLMEEFRVGDILELDQSGGSALSGMVGVGDLLTAGIAVADDANFANVDLGVSIPPLIDIDSAEISVIEHPKVACGRRGIARASSSQISVTVDGKILDITIPFWPVDIKVASIGLQVQFDFAYSTALLKNSICRAGTPAEPDHIDLTVDSTLVRPKVTLTLTLLNIPVELEVDPLSNPKSADVPIDLPGQGAWTTSTTWSGTPIGIGDIKVTKPFPLNVILEVPLSLLKPILVPVLNGLLGGQVLSNLLGVQLAGADLTAFSRPECGVPALRG